MMGQFQISKHHLMFDFTFLGYVLPANSLTAVLDILCANYG